MWRESAICCAPFVLHSHGFIRRDRKLHAFRYAEQHARTRNIFNLRFMATFPSWTSRVRSPSPALRFNKLQAIQKWRTSKSLDKEFIRQPPPAFPQLPVFERDSDRVDILVHIKRVTELVRYQFGVNLEFVYER